MGLTDSYSGIALNQNAIVDGQLNWRDSGGGWVYQTFTLPSDYARGTRAAETRVPDLSGIQVFLSIDDSYALSASLDYVLQYYGGDPDGWVTLTKGTTIGSHTDGFYVWFDVIFPKSVPIQSQLLTKQFRFGIQTRTATSAVFNQPVAISASGSYVINGQSFTAQLAPRVPFPITVGGQPAFLLSDGINVTYSIQQGINVLWYVTPTPLLHAATGQGQAYQSDGFTPLLGHGITASLNFRILAMTADNGTDFLDNEYRSVVVHTAPGNTSTTDGLNPVTGSGHAPYWMSPPQPSRFAVQSLYFDVRPVAATPAFGLINNIGNPSFEYDAPGLGPQWWQSFNSGGTVLEQTVHSTQVPVTNPNYSPWTYDRFQAMHMKYSFTARPQQTGIISDFQSVASVSTGQAIPISVSVAYNVIAQSNCSLYFTLLFYDNTQTLLPSPYGTVSIGPSSTGTGVLSGSVMMPAQTQYVRYLISALSTGVGNFEAYIDGCQATLTSIVQPYFDGDDDSAQWIATRGNSPSVQLVEPTADDNVVVIDGVLIDPLTPNMACNVYYSQDDAKTSDHMTEDDWEQKLWTHVPQVYLCSQRQQYVFPAPVRAKYMKAEFTNLQAQSYHPGNFQKSTKYKKFPTWVANYFISQMELPSFVATQVDVQLDALSFAYNYFLDDLDQTPANPSAPPQGAITQLSNYFSSATSGVDPTTLSKINLVMQPYQQTLGSLVKTDTSLGSFVSSLWNSNNGPVNTVEGGTLTPVDYSTVSSLQREPVIIEQSLPVMYFFITCRHTYKELVAPFEYNRAYFAGINDIAFIRNRYSVTADTDLYIESGGDLTNTAFTDWVQDSDTHWYCY